MALVLATPPGYETLREADGCKLSLGPRPEAGPRAVRAECTWPEADLDAARAMLLDYPAYRELVPNIREVEVRLREPGRALVWQVHHVPLVAGRESLVWMVETVPDHGGLRVSWSRADVPLEPRANRVVVPVNNGFWEVGTAPQGGVAIIHEVAYDPGVRVPEWLVARFRTNGLANVMESARARAAGTTPGP